MPYADVAVNAAAPLRQTFTYGIPDGLAVEPGHAVYVPFGTRTLQGIVLSVTDESAFARSATSKPSSTRGPSSPRLTSTSPAGSAITTLRPSSTASRSYSPPGIKRKPLTILEPLAAPDEFANLRLTEKQQTVLAHIIQRGEAVADELPRDIKITGVANAVSALVKRGFLRRCFRLARRPWPARRSRTSASLLPKTKCGRRPPAYITTISLARSDAPPSSNHSQTKARSRSRAPAPSG